MATAADVMDYLRGKRTDFKIITHPPYSSLNDMASARGLSPDEVAEVRVLKADNRYVMAVVPAGSEVCQQRLRDLLQVKELKGVSEWDVERLFPTCEVGTVAPFGHLFAILVVADACFERSGRIVFSACSETISLAMEWRDYRRLVNPVVAPIAAAGAPTDLLAANAG